MVKKIIAAGAATAVALLMTAGAFAYEGYGGGHRHHKKGTTNVAIVRDNNVVAVANSGFNRISGKGGGEQEIETGDAYAEASQENLLNTSDCGCRRGRRGEKTTNIAVVANNNVVALANTGVNSIGGGYRRGNNTGGFEAEGGGYRRHHGGEQEIETGDAEAIAWQTNVLNSTVEGED